jgi:hypothetical protein
VIVSGTISILGSLCTRCGVWEGVIAGDVFWSVRLMHGPGTKKDSVVVVLMKRSV